MGVGLFLQGLGFYGGSFGNLLFQLEQQGFFAYILPFLLIFAIVFGILMKIGIFGDKKGLNAVIAIATGLLALQFDFVPLFFSDIFPRVGIALSVILALFILVGIFLPTDKDSDLAKAVNWILLGIGIIIFIIVISKSFAFFGFGTSSIGYFIYSNLPFIITIVIVLVAIGAVVGAKTKKGPDFGNPYWRVIPER